jgi:hypothetical protein
MGEEIFLSSGLKLDGNYYNDLDISGFSQMLKDPSYCYKFYWLEAIVKLISRDIKETTFGEIIDEMICNAWYTVLEYHVHLSGLMLGEARDGLERAIYRLHDLSKLRSDADSEEIKREIYEWNGDVEFKEYKKQLTNNVPFYALSQFFENHGYKVDGTVGRFIKYAELINLISPLPYTIGKASGLKREVYFNENWIQMIHDNTVTILGWIQYEKVKWLQNNNPEVPSLVYKLTPMDMTMRKLDHVRNLWEAILKQQKIIDVFTEDPIEKKYDIDHFIPRSFVMNDELWNLMPMDSNLNSSKNNRLPNWSRYFGRYANNQFILYNMINDTEMPQIRKLFEACYKDNLHSIWGGELYKKGKSKEEFFNILSKNMEPVYDSAKRQGYQEWRV